jgi:hypothetical protein
MSKHEKRLVKAIYKRLKNLAAGQSQPSGFAGRKDEKRQADFADLVRAVALGHERSPDRIRRRLRECCKTHEQLRWAVERFNGAVSLSHRVPGEILTRSSCPPPAA